MSDKQKHLDYIQAVISRMASNSFTIKGWTVTLTLAVLAVDATQSGKSFGVLAFLPIFSFWILDAYYLNQERLFRHLYKSVRTKEESAIDYSMSTEEFKAEENWLFTMYSKTLLPFYLPVIAMTLIVMFCLNGGA